MDNQDMPHLDDFGTIFEVFVFLAAARQEQDAKLQELFGDEQNLPSDEEAEIVFDFTMTHEQQVSGLKQLRAKKRARTRDMVRRPTLEDLQLARSMGIIL